MIDFSAGRGAIGVDLRWYPKHEFVKLPKNQKDKLSSWLQTEEGKQINKVPLQMTNHQRSAKATIRELMAGRRSSKPNSKVTEDLSQL